MADVKRPRETRAERAARTRERIIGAARDRFVSDGYEATTVAEIASAAGVAFQTVYWAFGSKPALLREVVEVTVTGQDVGPLLRERPWTREIMSGVTAQRILALTADHSTDVYARAAPLWPSVRTALSDPIIGQYWDSVTAARRVGMEQMVDQIAEIDSLRAGLTHERATDLVYTLAGHETYQNLVLHAGWPQNEFKAWLFETLVHQLLGLIPLDLSAVEGLPFREHVVAT